MSKSKRLLAMLLAIMMVVSVLPISTLAASAESTGTITAVDMTGMVTDTVFPYSGDYSNTTERWTGNTINLVETPTFYNTLKVTVDGVTKEVSGFTWADADPAHPYVASAVGSTFNFVAVAPAGYTFDASATIPQISVYVLDGAYANGSGALKYVSATDKPVPVVVKSAYGVIEGALETDNVAYDATGCNIIYKTSAGVINFNSNHKVCVGLGGGTTYMAGKTPITTSALNNKVILDGATLTNVFCGGVKSTMTGIGTMEIKGNSNISNVYAGGYAYKYYSPTVSNHSVVNVSGRAVVGNIIGTGLAATGYVSTFEGDLTVNVSSDFVGTLSSIQRGTAASLVVNAPTNFDTSVIQNYGTDPAITVNLSGQGTELINSADYTPATTVYTAALGTTFENVGLPTTINNVAGFTWQCDNYDANTTGTYTATLVAPAYYAFNGAAPTVTITVFSADAVVTLQEYATTPDAMSVPLGTKFANIAAPSSIDVWDVNYGWNTLAEGTDYTWTSTDYKFNQPGTYTIHPLLNAQNYILADGANLDVQITVETSTSAITAITVPVQAAYAISSNTSFGTLYTAPALYNTLNVTRADGTTGTIDVTWKCLSQFDPAIPGAYIYALDLENMAQGGYITDDVAATAQITWNVLNYSMAHGGSGKYPTGGMSFILDGNNFYDTTGTTNIFNYTISSAYDMYAGSLNADLTLDHEVVIYIKNSTLETVNGGGLNGSVTGNVTYYVDSTSSITSFNAGSEGSGAVTGTVSLHLEDGAKVSGTITRGTADKLKVYITNLTYIDQITNAYADTNTEVYYNNVKVNFISAATTTVFSVQQDEYTDLASLGALVPTAITATVNGSTATVPVTGWTADDFTFDGTKAYTYNYTPVIDSSYLFVSGATVADAKMSITVIPDVEYPTSNFAGYSNFTTAYGTAAADLANVDKVTADVNYGGVVGTKNVTIPLITWTSEDYNPYTPGDYTFTMVLPAGYVLAEGATLPTVTVTVADYVGSRIVGFNVPVSETSFISGVVTDPKFYSSLEATVIENGVTRTETVSGLVWNCTTAYNKTYNTDAGAVNDYTFAIDRTCAPAGYVIYPSAVNASTINVHIVNTGFGMQYGYYHFNAQDVFPITMGYNTTSSAPAIMDATGNNILKTITTTSKLGIGGGQTAVGVLGVKLTTGDIGVKITETVNPVTIARLFGGGLAVSHTGNTTLEVGGNTSLTSGLVIGSCNAAFTGDAHVTISGAANVGSITCGSVYITGLLSATGGQNMVSDDAVAFNGDIYLTVADNFTGNISTIDVPATTNGTVYITIPTGFPTSKIEGFGTDTRIVVVQDGVTYVPAANYPSTRLLVPVGTAKGDLELPTTFFGVDGYTWTSETYDGNTEGTYVFTLVPPSSISIVGGTVSAEVKVGTDETITAIDSTNLVTSTVLPSSITSPVFYDQLTVTADGVTKAVSGFTWESTTTFDPTNTTTTYTFKPVAPIGYNYDASIVLPEISVTMTAADITLQGSYVMLNNIPALIKGDYDYATDIGNYTYIYDKTGCNKLFVTSVADSRVYAGVTGTDTANYNTTVETIDVTIENALMNQFVGSGSAKQTINNINLTVKNSKFFNETVSSDKATQNGALWVAGYGAFDEAGGASTSGTSYVTAKNVNVTLTNVRTSATQVATASTYAYSSTAGIWLGGYQATVENLTATVNGASSLYTLNVGARGNAPAGTVASANVTIGSAVAIDTLAIAGYRSTVTNPVITIAAGATIGAMTTATSSSGDSVVGKVRFNLENGDLTQTAIGVAAYKVVYVNGTRAYPETLADYTTVEAAIASIPADLTIYTTETVDALNAAVAAVIYELGTENQTVVDGYATAITTAATNLKVIVILGDYTALNVEKARYEALVRAAYAPADLTAVDEYYATISWEVSQDNQATIDTYTSTLKGMLDALVPVASIATVVADSYVNTTYVPLNTEILANSFYNTISATVGETVNNIAVTWSSADYNAAAVGTYTFTATSTQAGVVFATNPTITVKVVDATMAVDAEAYTVFLGGLSAKIKGDYNLTTDVATYTYIYDLTGCIQLNANNIMGYTVYGTDRYTNTAKFDANYDQITMVVENAVLETLGAIGNNKVNVTTVNLTVKDTKITKNLFAAGDGRGTSTGGTSSYSTAYAAVDTANVTLTNVICDSDYTNYETTNGVYLAGYQVKLKDLNAVVDGNSTIDLLTIGARGNSTSSYVTGGVYKATIGSGVKVTDALRLGAYRAQLGGLDLTIESGATIASFIDVTQAAGTALAAPAILGQATFKLADYTYASTLYTLPNLATKTVYVNDVEYTGTTPVELVYDALNAAIATVPADLTVYTQATADEVTAKLAAANTALTSATTQEQIDTAASELDTAVKALVYKDADYTAVDAALATVPADLTVYTDTTATAVTNAVNAVVRGYNITRQGDVDTMAANINAAVGALELKPVVVTRPNLVVSTQTRGTATVNESTKTINATLQTGSSNCYFSFTLLTGETMAISNIRNLITAELTTMVLKDGTRSVRIYRPTYGTPTFDVTFTSAEYGAVTYTMIVDCGLGDAPVEKTMPMPAASQLRCTVTQDAFLHTVVLTPESEATTNFKAYINYGTGESLTLKSSEGGSATLSGKYLTIYKPTFGQVTGVLTYTDANGVATDFAFTTAFKTIKTELVKSGTRCTGYTDTANKIIYITADTGSSNCLIDFDIDTTWQVLTVNSQTKPVVTEAAKLGAYNKVIAAGGTEEAAQAAKAAALNIQMESATSIRVYDGLIGDVVGYVVLTPSTGTAVTYQIRVGFGNKFNSVLRAIMSYTAEAPNDIKLTLSGSNRTSMYVSCNNPQEGQYVTTTDYSRNLDGMLAIEGTAVRIYNTGFDMGTFKLNVHNADGSIASTYNLTVDFQNAAFKIVKEALRTEGDPVVVTNGDGSATYTFTGKAGEKNATITFGKYLGETFTMTNVEGGRVVIPTGTSIRVYRSETPVTFDLIFTGNTSQTQRVIHVVVNW